MPQVFGAAGVALAMSSDELAQFLAGSPDRRRVLTRLAAHPGSPAELAEAVPLSRRSVQRHLGQFVERGWATDDGSTYRLTTTGELVVEEHATYLETLDRIERYRPFFGRLPDAEHAPDPRWVADATLVAATPENPQAPVREYIERVRTFDTGRVRMVSPVLSRMFHDVHAELAMDGVHTELVMAADTVERARELNPTEFEFVVGVDVLDLYRSPDVVAFGLTLGDRDVLMGAYDDDGHLGACVHATNAEFRQWGENLFERYRGRADLVEPSSS